jgi:hypothetical protein
VHRLRRTLAATTAALVLVFSASIAVYAAPVSYVSLDNAVGVSLTLNRFNRVISVTGHDDASRALLAGLALMNRTYEEGVQAILAASESRGGIGFDVRTIVAVASDDEALSQTIRDRIRAYLETEYDEHGRKPDVETDSVDVSLSREAKGLGVSQGKLRLMQLLEHVLGDDYVQSDWIGKPSSTILAELERLGVDSEQDEDDAKNGTTGHPSATQGRKPTVSAEPTESGHEGEARPSVSATPGHDSEDHPSDTPEPGREGTGGAGHPTLVATPEVDD